MKSNRGESIGAPLILTIASLIAFAGNSVLARLALGGGRIDPPTYTVMRLLAGSIVLVVISAIRTGATKDTSKGSWFASIMLFLYAITLSIAYVTLDAGTGALILFGSVQITIMVVSLIAGSRPAVLEWIGGTCAFLGFVYLVLPGVTAPSASGFIFMIVAGAA